MINEFEIYSDSDGNNHLIFDQSALYDDSLIGDKLTDFEVLKILGSSDKINPISKVRCLKNNKIYSMKKIDLDKIENEEDKKLCEEQLEKLISLDHPHLIKYFKFFKDEEGKNIFVIYDYMNNSDLNSLIDAHIALKKKVKEETVWNILLQCLSGLSYLHSEDIKTLLIKPTNIYLNNEQNTKISLFYQTAASKYKNYDIQQDIYFIGKYFYKMCCLIKQDEDKWIDHIEIEDNNNPNNYSKELMNIIYMMSEFSKEKKNAQQLYEIVKKEYVKKFKKITSIDAVLRCLYSFPYFNKDILLKSEYIKNNTKKCYISYWFLNSIEAIKEKKNLVECYEEFRRALASANSKIDCSKEVDPVFLFVFLLEKMHKELNRKVTTTLMPNKDANDQYVINSFYTMEEKEDKTNKIEMLNKFKSYVKENINSIISSSFYGIIKFKKICPQCKNGFYSFSNLFCAAFDLTKNSSNSNKNINNLNNNYFDLEKAFTTKKRESKLVCEVCLTEQTFVEFEDYYEMARHLVICFYRGFKYASDKRINFNKVMKIIENQGLEEKKTVEFELIGSVNRVVNNGEEEFICFYKDLDKPYRWHSKNNEQDGCPLDEIQKTGQIIMLFYDKI